MPALIRLRVLSREGLDQSLLSAVMRYAIGREIFPQRLPAVFSALIYLTLLPVARHGRLAMLDGAVVCFPVYDLVFVAIAPQSTLLLGRWHWFWADLPHQRNFRVITRRDRSVVSPLGYTATTH